jgi:hypothetical protein
MLSLSQTGRSWTITSLAVITWVESMTSILQSIPSRMKIRDKLEQKVLADLLSPVGETEV